MTTVRVAIVDDHTILREGLRSLLALDPRIQVVADVGDASSAVEALVRLDIDVVLLDVRLGATSGFDVVRGARARGSRAAFLVLTTFDDDAIFGEALEVGAKGYLLKDTSTGDLVDAIVAIANGRTAFRPGMTERARTRLPATGTSGLVVEKPTGREREILRLLAGGLSNREIGEKLGVAEGTVKNHVSSLLTKLGVRDRTRAVLRAIELRWI